jgi:hypothetical protein
MMSSLRPLCCGLFALVVAAVTACSGPLQPIATLVTIVDTTTVYALNGTPSATPNAIDLFDGSTVRADVTFNYDLVFDLDSNFQVLVIPVRRLTTVAGGFQVGMQVVSGDYDALGTAPKSNYVNDSTFVVPVGTVLAIQSGNPTVCDPTLSASPYTYSKIGILSVNKANRSIRVAFTVDRNCSFRSYAGGLPNS